MNFSKLLPQIQAALGRPKYAVRLPILFLHIPKTAGTSLRIAAEKSRLIPEILRDYGPLEKNNSPEIHKARYLDESQEKVQALLASRRDYLLTGHFSAQTYLKDFYPYEVITFVREPIERVISSFYYAQRKHSYIGSLKEFIQDQGRINLQSKQINPLRVEHFGFIGIADKFDQSIEILNQIYGVGLKPRYLNKNPKKQGRGYQITDRERALIQQYNQQDMAVYSRADQLMVNRKKYLKPGSKPVYGSWDIQKNVLSGWAYQAWNEDALSLALAINGKTVSTTLANLYSPLPYECKQPREGYIGFEFNLEPGWTAGNQIRVFEPDSQQPLMNYGNHT